jgi:hypothetical protein
MKTLQALAICREALNVSIALTTQATKRYASVTNLDADIIFSAAKNALDATQFDKLDDDQFGKKNG